MYIYTCSPLKKIYVNVHIYMTQFDPQKPPKRNLICRNHRNHKKTSIQVNLQKLLLDKYMYIYIYRFWKIRPRPNVYKTTHTPNTEIAQFDLQKPPKSQKNLNFILAGRIRIAPCDLNHVKKCAPRT